MTKRLINRGTDTDGNTVSIWKVIDRSGRSTYRVLVNVHTVGAMDFPTLRGAYDHAGISTQPKKASRVPVETKPKKDYEEQVRGFHRNAKHGK